MASASSLSAQYPGDTFKSLLRVDNNADGITGTAQQVYDGEGTSCPLYLGSSSVDIYGLLTVGSDGLGSDVKFYGGTSGKYMLWDKSENELVIEGTLRIEGDATFSSDSVYLKDDGYNSGTPVKALSLNTSDGAIKIAGVEMKTTGVMKLKTLTQAQQEALTPALGDIVMRSDGLTAKTEPYLYSD